MSISASRFCPGSFTEEQALRAALATWPPGVRPVVHWSESQEGRKAHAHSDFIEARTLPWMHTLVRVQGAHLPGFGLVMYARYPRALTER